jgi:hypothetical protein
MTEEAQEPQELPEVERFRPGGVMHALVSGLVELALASVCLGLALELGERSDQAQTSLLVAALLWLALAVVSLAVAGLRARVDEAELDAGGVTLAGPRGRRHLAWDELSAVEVSRAGARLVLRDGRKRRVRGVRGAAQARRFRERVLARATAASGAGPDTLPDGGGTTPADEPGEENLDRSESNGDGGPSTARRRP